MLNYFPKFFSSKAIYCYLITLALVSIVFMRYALPFQFMLFGLVPVIVFFAFANRLTMDWYHISPKQFSKKVCITAVIIRLVYVVFIYFYYIQMTGEPHSFHKAEEAA